MRPKDVMRTPECQVLKANWRTSTFCGPNGGNCVEVNLGTRDAVGVRDGKFRDGPILLFDHTRWRDFLTATRTGTFDVA